MTIVNDWSSISLKLHLLMTLESSFTIVTCFQHRPLESISPTNLCNIQWCQPIVNGAKDAFSISPTILQKICYMFWATAFAPTPYFGTFLPNVVAIKSIKNHLCKSYPALAARMLMKLTPGLISRYH
jgi:hypothetical protein